MTGIDLVYCSITIIDSFGAGLSEVHYKFSIDDHPLSVIAADSNPLVQVDDVHQLPIGIGQRVRISSSV